MKSKIVGLVIVLVVVLGFTSVSFAGNPNNSSVNASATAIVGCFLQRGANFHQVAEKDLWVGGCHDGIVLGLSALGCVNNLPCVSCLNGLQEVGLSVIASSCGPLASNVVDQDFQVCTYTLTGNATPIINRLGLCEG